MFENRDICRKIIQEKSILSLFNMIAQEEEMMLSERARGTINLQNNVIKQLSKYSLQGTTQGRYLTGGVPPIRFSM